VVDIIHEAGGDSGVDLLDAPALAVVAVDGRSIESNLSVLGVIGKGLCRPIACLIAGGVVLARSQTICARVESRERLRSQRGVGKVAGRDGAVAKTIVVIGLRPVTGLGGRL